MPKTSKTAYYTIQEVADSLRLTYDTVWKLIRNDKLSSHRMGPRGGSVRVSQQDLDDYARSTRTKKRGK